jgi:iron complex outermembrane receptor protein
MRKVRRTILSTLITSTLLVSVTANAQSAAKPDEAASPPATPSPSGEAKTLDEVQVIGIRGSLEAAKDIKRDSVQIVDAIVADDIGKLPDTNVAESLSRVAGVQLERGMGEGSDVLVRGLRENVILYNGRQIVDATGRGGNGLDQLNTSTYGLLTLVPSELISRLSVTKLAGADQIAGALGGIIDIDTRKPLSGDASQNVVSVEASHDELASKGGGNVFALVSGRNADSSFGGLLAATYSKQHVAQQGLDTFSGYASFTDNAEAPPRARFGSTDMRAQDINDEREKYGVSGILEWRPADGVEITADTFYSKQEAKRDRYWIAFNPSAALSNAVYSPHDVLIKGTSSGPVLLNTEVADIDADVWSSALRASFRVGNNLGGSVEASYGESASNYHQNYMRLQPMADLTSVVNFDLTNGDFGSFNVSGVDLTDPAQMRLSILFDNDYRAEADTTALRTDWTWDFDSAVHSFDFGARYNKLDSRQDPRRADIRPDGGIPTVELGDFLGVHTNNDFMPGEFIGLPRSFLGGNRATFTGCEAFTTVPSISQNPQCLDGRNNTLAYAGTFTIGEEFTEAYAKLEYDTLLGDIQLSGNVGLRYVGRELDSRGNLINPDGTPQPTSFRRSDDYWLPSGVVKLELNDNLVLRGGAARVVAFPNTEDLNNGVSLNNNAVFDADGVQITPGTGSGGAPALDPFQADQYDLSLEWYYSDEGMLSAGLFYKDVSTFIVQRQSAETYGGVNFLINRKVNGDSASVRGLELLAQVPFTFLPDSWNGFGIVATYTYVDSKTPIVDVTGQEMPFPGLSENNVNLIGYYEQGPFSARLAYNWRDEYLVGLSAAATGIFNDTYKDLSATFSYDINDRVTIQLDAINLLDSQQRTYDGFEEGLRTNVLFGRGYKGTLTWRF